MIIVMYHYVRPSDPELPFFNALDVNLFRRQIEYFRSAYGFLSRDEFINAISGAGNQNGVVLTFDDGFKDHAQYVLPVLREYGLWGIFYIPCGPYILASRKLLGVHRVHYLKGRYGAGEILNAALKLTRDYMLDESTIEAFDKEIYTYTDYDADEKKLRRLFNYYLKYEYRDVILDELMPLYCSEEKLASEYYLSPAEIKDLHAAGNIIGSHTVSHPVLSRLSRQDQLAEISDSFNFVESITGPGLRSFCYPYGYKTSYNDDTLNVLEELRVHNAVIFDNKIQDGMLVRYEMSRIDCNKFQQV